MLTEWVSGRYPQLEVTSDDAQKGASLQIRSPRSGGVLRLTVTYDRRYQAPPSAPGAQLLVGSSHALLLPRGEAPPPRSWWCGESRLVGDIVAHDGWAIAINPQERLIATITTCDLARSAKLLTARPKDKLLCFVDSLEHARLDGEGMHTPVSEAIDEEMAREQAREDELLRRWKEEDRTRTLREAETQRAAPGPERPPSSHAFAPMPTHELTHEPAVSGSSPYEDAWPSHLDALRRLLGDESLAQRLEQPLSTDVECDVPPAVWHLMAVLEWRRRGGDAHPHAVRASIVQHGCGYRLTGAAVAGILAVARDHSSRR